MYLKMKEASMALCLGLTCMPALAQQRQVTGTVKDVNGEPMIGVTIMINGRSAAVTDLDGNYTISNVNPNSKLTVSYVGYQEQVVTIGNRTTINLTMKEDNQNLDEVVVIGYGTMKKKDLTGSVASVNTKDINQVASANALQAMQAKVPGVDLQQSDGQAGSGVSMTLRGNRSLLASNNPLILVDGVEYGSTLDIPASDIESMDILKDAASTAIYGTKGANGVIIITTKRGKAGRTSVSFNGYLSFNSATGVTKSMYGDKEVQRLIDKKDYEDAAKVLGVEVAVVKAVKDVEAGGAGYVFSNHPTILFESHVFWRELKKRGIVPSKYRDNEILNQTQKKGKAYYVGGVGEYARLLKARLINTDAANASASWGLFQIMGNNYKACGCRTIDAFVKLMSKGEREQLMLFMEFIKNSGDMLSCLKKKDWEGFACRYNGSDYKDNNYHIKLQNAYNKYKR